jgi:hypothetical protein
MGIFYLNIEENYESHDNNFAAMKGILKSASSNAVVGEI